MKAKLIVALIVIVLLSSEALAKGFNDNSDMSTPDLVKCAAAAMKIDRDLWGHWYAAIKSRYEIIYKDKSPKEIEEYTHIRVIEKRKALNRLGFDSKMAFRDYFNKNCAGEI